MEFDKDYYNSYLENKSLDSEYNFNKYECDFKENFDNCFNLDKNQFIQNFMKIDYDVDYQRIFESPIQSKPNDDISTHSSVKSQNKELILNSSSDNKDLGRVGFLIGGKKGRPMTDMNIIIDEVNNKIYDPMIDPEEYKKARKRIQNRESAIRSRCKKKETNKQIETELEYYKKENFRLIHENSYLKKEKIFLIDQIKFMQSIIKSNNNQINIDIEKNVTSQSKIYLNGGKQKSVGKIFSICMFCIISVVYISYDGSYNEVGKIDFSNGSTMTLNDIQITKNEYNYWKFLYGLMALISTYVLYKIVSKFINKINIKSDKIL